MRFDMGGLPDWVLVIIFIVLFPVWFVWMLVDKARMRFSGEKRKC